MAFKFITERPGLSAVLLGVTVALGVAFVAAVGQVVPRVDMDQKWRSAYYLQPKSQILPIVAIPFSKYTHVIQYAVLPAYDAATDTCRVDAAAYGIAANTSEFVQGAHAAGVKALVSMLHDTSATAIRTCTDPVHVSRFSSAIASFVSANGYDGFDIDWELRIIDSQYQQWITSLRAALPGKLLTVFASWNQRYVIAQVQDKLDQINCGTYDSDVGTVNGSWRTDTAYNSALYQSSSHDWVTADIITFYMTGDARIARSKIGVGMPFYGRIKGGCRTGYLFGNTCTQTVTDPGQPYASGNALINPRTPIDYRNLVNSAYWSSGTQVWDATHGAQYIRFAGPDGSQAAFVPYTGPEQISEAVRYVRAANLGGVMTYELAGEYIASETGDGRFPLSSAMYRTWQDISMGMRRHPLHLAIPVPRQ